MIEKKNLKILIVEDNVDHAELIKDSLEEYNPSNTVFHVEDGEKAIDFLQGRAPYDKQGNPEGIDLVLLDIRMPRQNGIDTLREIRQSKSTRSIPVVMISTTKNESEIGLCFDLGANGYVSKSIGFGEFYKKIQDLNYYWGQVSELPKKKGLVS